MTYRPDYFTADADTWCEDCLTSRYGSTEGADAEGNGIGAVFGEESDTPQYCAGCGAFLENPLTPDGVAYVVEAVVEALAHGRADSVALTDWAPYYGLPSTLEPDRYADRVDIVRGAYWACADYHGGQASRGYRHLCKLGRHYRPGPLESSRTLEGDALAAYVRVAAAL